MTEMLIGLFLIISFYFFYMLSLVVVDSVGLVFIVFFGVGYVLYFSIISRKSEHSLYSFLLITLFFPKAGNNFVLFSIQELTGISLFAILQTVAAAAICLNLMKTGGLNSKMPSGLMRFCQLIFFTIVFTTTMSVMRWFVGDFADVQIRPEELVWNGQILFGLIFLLGCMAFIKTIDMVEKIFLFVIACGILMVVEVLLYFYLQLPLPGTKYVFDETGRYRSIFLFDFVTLTLILYSAIGFTLYFVFTKKRYILILLIPLMFLPIIPTFQRTPVVSIIIVVVITLMLRKNIAFKPAVFITIFLFIGALNLLKMNDLNVESMSPIFMDVRPDYFTSYQSSWTIRTGAYLRGIEVFIFSFPYGVGPGRMSQIMGSASVPQYLQDFAKLGEMEMFYTAIASGRETEAHNLYLNFMGEYGVLGIIIMAAFIYMCRKNYSLTRGKKLMNPKLFFAQAASYAVLMGMSFWFIFYHYTFYWLMFFLLYITFFDAEAKVMALRSRAIPGKL